MSALIPPNWTPQERSLATTAERASQIPIRIKEVWSPWECPLDLLPWLAWALHVDSWEAGWSERKKRAVVAASIEVHRKKGTIGALRRALQALGYEVHVDERTGVPYTFRLQVNVSEHGGNAIAYQEIERVAQETKNVRSHLIGIDALMETEAVTHIGAVTVTGVDTEVLPFMVRELVAEAGLFIAIAEHTEDIARIFPIFSSMIESSGRFFAAGIVNIEIQI